MNQVTFSEVKPPVHLSKVVHRFIEIKATSKLQEDFIFHALPDLCTYIIFNQLNVNTTGVTKLCTVSEEITLGREFHYVNIRFLPGVWKDDITYGAVTKSYEGALQLNDINESLIRLDFNNKQRVLSRFVEALIKTNKVIDNPITESIFSHLDIIHTVSDMAKITGFSSRQLQRNLKLTTGFTPNDFLKILRFQQSLEGMDYHLYYTDQPHFIHSFKKATGYTPGHYTSKFDV